MAELIKELTRVWNWMRQHWKGVIAFLLAALAMSIILTFPIASITLIGSSAPFSAYLDMEIILFLLEEIPVALMVASGVTALFTFVSVLGLASIFNFANYVYAEAYEYIFKPMLENQAIVAVLVVASIVSMSLVAAFAGGLWFIPFAIAAVPVINKVIEILDKKINPRCDFITLPADFKCGSKIKIEEDIVRLMQFGRNSFLIGPGRSYFRQGNNIFQAAWNRDKKHYYFEQVHLADTSEMDKLRAEKFRAMFELPNDPNGENKDQVVYRARSFLDMDSSVFMEDDAAVAAAGQVVQGQAPVSTPNGLLIMVTPTATSTATATTLITTATTTTTFTTTVVPISPIAMINPVKPMQRRNSAPNLTTYSNVYPNRNATFQQSMLPPDAQPVLPDAQPVLEVAPSTGL